MHLWPRTAFDPEQVRQDLRSPDREVRGRAVRGLTAQARTDAAIRPAALSILRQALADEREPCVAGDVAQGIETIAGSDEGLKAWLTLLGRPEANVVAHAALAATDKAYVPVLLDLLRTHPDVAVQRCAIRTLGRSTTSKVFEALVERLNVPALRVDVIEALGDLEDARSVPYLEPLLADTGEARLDDRGYPLTVADVTASAIRRVTRQRVAADPTLAGHVPAYEPPAIPFVTTDAPRVRPPARPAAYIPIVVAVLEVFWIIAVLFTEYVTTGTIAQNSPRGNAISFIIMTPASIGLLAGLFIFVRERPRRVEEFVCLVVGVAWCGLYLFAFGGELLR